MVHATERRLSLISSVAAAAVLERIFIWPAPSDIRPARSDKILDEPFRLSVIPATSRTMLHIFSTNTLNHLACSPSSSPRLTASRRVRSPSPAAISLSMVTIFLIGRLTLKPVRIEMPKPLINPSDSNSVMLLTALFLAASTIPAVSCLKVLIRDKPASFWFSMVSVICRLSLQSLAICSNWGRL